MISGAGNPFLRLYSVHHQAIPYAIPYPSLRLYSLATPSIPSTQCSVLTYKVCVVFIVGKRKKKSETECIQFSLHPTNKLAIKFSNFGLIVNI